MGAQALPSGGWRWSSQGLAGGAGHHQPLPSLKEPFGIDVLKLEEVSSPHAEFGDTMAEVCRCRLSTVTASSLRCELSDMRMLLHPLLNSCFCTALLFKPLSFACWSVPAMKSILDMQGVKGRSLVVMVQLFPVLFLPVT